ncbi:MAG: ABC transporter ATP-binding protein [Burkholderiales bacterium]|nr:ABC transporter ATP-binding protein [Burkholderiales bacterium]
MPPGAPAAMGHSLKLEAITHRFGEFVAVRDIDLDIAAGELVALLGPSGCGKSTLLRIVSGFLAQSAGRVLFDGEPVDHLPPNRRGVGIVFQNYALFPHMTVAENVAYGLHARGTPRQAVRARVDEMLELVHMSALADRLPRQLSGGQQQRIALARCLAVQPKILLLDEPFGALDKNLRLDMQIEVKRLQRASGVTAIMVTHDQEEALSMADRIAVMNHGVIEQVSPPTEVYDRPSSLFVSQFVGTTNVLPGRVATCDGARADVTLADGTRIACEATVRAAVGEDVLVSVRPERLALRGAPGDGAIPATVKVVLPLGPVVVYEAETQAGQPMKISAPREGGARLLEPGARVYVAPAAPDAARLFRPAASRAGSSGTRAAS